MKRKILPSTMKRMTMTKIKNFVENKRYSITWKNLSKQVVSTGYVVTADDRNQLLRFRDDKLKAVIIIPVRCVISHKLI